MSGKKSTILGFIVGVIILTGLDQWTKRLVTDGLKGKGPVVLWDGVFEFFYSENRGAAFGMLQGRQFFFFVVAAVVFVAVFYAMWKLPGERRYLPLKICLTLIASGAAGNLIDRVVQGYVVDFLYFKLIDFPIFNVADCYVTVATAVLLFLVLKVYSDEDFEVLKPGGGSKGSEDKTDTGKEL